MPGNRVLRRLGPLVVGVAAVAPAHAQDVPPRAAFDVAAVRTNTSGETTSVGGALQPGGRFIIVNAPLRQIIRVAYQRQITGGPAWIDSSRFDVTANAGAAATPQQAWAMLRTLLEERFKLRVHEERQEVPAYALVRAGNGERLGSGLRRADFDCAAAAQRGERSAFERQGGQAPRCGIELGFGRLFAGGVSLGQLAGVLSKVAGRTVIDRTDLTGGFDVQLSWTPDQPRDAGPSVDAPASLATSIFTAIREQLGLQLRPDRSEVNVIVIDSVDLPSPD